MNIRKLLYFFFAFPALTYACDFTDIKSVPPETMKKIQSADLKNVNCESIAYVLKKYMKKDAIAGRRLLNEDRGATEDSIHSICRDQELKSKLLQANNINDAEVRKIITASLLEDASEFDVMSSVLNGKVDKLCSGK